MKIKKELVEQREAFVTNFFKTTPTGSVRDLNSQLSNLFGKKMALSRIYQLRKNTVGCVDCRALNPMVVKGTVTQVVINSLASDQKEPLTEVPSIEGKSPKQVEEIFTSLIEGANVPTEDSLLD